jgi:hypothetical protein
MSRPKAASRAAASNVAAALAALLSPARAEASRKNGARSKGPTTPEGKAHAARNALKHGLCAGHHVVVEGESPEAFVAFEAALVADLAPAGALQTLLAGRIARAAWRLERAERIEAELFARQMDGPFGDGDLGLALIRDGNGARAFDTLLRYRGAAQAELFRTLRTLKALQAEAAQQAAPPRRVPVPPPQPADPREPASDPSPEPPNKPEVRANAGESRCEPGSPEPEAAAPGPTRPAAIAPALAAMPHAQPSEPRPKQAAGSAPSFPSQRAAAAGSASLLAGTALVPIGRRNGN